MSEHATGTMLKQFMDTEFTHRGFMRFIDTCLVQDMLPSPSRVIIPMDYYCTFLPCLLAGLSASLVFEPRQCEESASLKGESLTSNHLRNSLKKTNHHHSHTECHTSDSRDGLPAARAEFNVAQRW